MKGKFIVFEGIDACGKGTQLEKSKDYLSDKGLDLFLVREPGGVRISEAIREIILNKDYTEMASTPELFLYEAARAQLVQQLINPNLEKGMWGLGDRFSESSIAYQSFGRGININKVIWANEYATEGLIPDITFIFDVPVEVSLQRRKKNPDRMEREDGEFFERVRKGYLSIPEILDGNYKIIDGTQSIDKVFEETRGYIDAIL